MNCPVMMIANEVVDRLREADESELAVAFAGFDWLLNNLLPSLEEQCMGIPPDRFLRPIPGGNWHIGYDLRYQTSIQPFMSIFPKEVWVWFVGSSREIDATLLQRRTA